MSTSYSNPQGSGNRTSGANLVTVTSTLGIIGTWENIVNGGSAWIWGGSAAAGKYFQFDFGAGASKVIDEITWTQTYSVDMGTWKVQWSADGTNWTDCTSNFTLGVGGPPQVISPSGAQGLRYLRFLGISGSWNSGPYVNQITFKIDDYVAAEAPADCTSITTCEEIPPPGVVTVEGAGAIIAYDNQPKVTAETARLLALWGEVSHVFVEGSHILALWSEFQDAPAECRSITFCEDIPAPLDSCRSASFCENIELLKPEECRSFTTCENLDKSTPTELSSKTMVQDIPLAYGEGTFMVF